MTKIKICGITKKQEAEVLNRLSVDYVGMVLFFEKSPRNTDINTAMAIIESLDSSIKKVAVTVSPDLKQLKAIEAAGFDYIQIHKEMSDEVYEASHIPIIRALNISEKPNQKFVNKTKELLTKSKIEGILFDAGIPGSGVTFDWESINELKMLVKSYGKQLFLAGGLCTENVREAIVNVEPNVVDVSSGVEFDKSDGVFKGKNPVLVESFVNEARR